MFMWVMVEDVLGDICGFSLVDLDRDGYGGVGSGGRSASILFPADTQPLMVKICGHPLAFGSLLVPAKSV